MAARHRHQRRDAAAAGEEQIARRAGWSAQVNSPIGPSARSAMPGRSVSCIQLETGPPGTRLVVIETSCGRVGEEARV